MVYQITEPQATSSIKSTQQPILDNWIEINTDFARNHVGLQDATVGNRGKHTLIQFPTRQMGDPGTAATELALYTKIGAASTQSELFLQMENSAIGVNVRNLTEVRTAAGDRFFQLPNGLIVLLGLGTVNGVAVQNFPGGIPPVGRAIHTQLTVNGGVTTALSNFAVSFVAYDPVMVPVGTGATGIRVWGGNRTSLTDVNASFQYMVIYIPA